MPRTARAALGGVMYHVLNRGNGLRRVFRKPEDYLVFTNLAGGGPRACRGGGICILPDAQPLAFAASSPGGWGLGGMMEKVTFSRHRLGDRVNFIWRTLYVGREPESQQTDNFA